MILRILAALLLSMPGGEPTPDAARFTITTIDGRRLNGRALFLAAGQDSVQLDAADDSSANPGASLALQDLAEIHVAPTAADSDADAATTGLRGDPAAGAPILEFLTSGGARILGRALRTTRGDAGQSIQLQSLAGPAITIALRDLAAARFAPRETDAAAQAEFERLCAVHPRPGDQLLARTPAGVSAFGGALEQLSDAGWRFAVGARTLTGDYGRAYGVVLATQGPAPGPAAGDAAVETTDGSAWRGRLAALAADGLTLELRGMGNVELPWSRIRRVALRSGRVRFLSDLTPDAFESDGFFGGPWPLGRDRTAAGDPLRLGGRTYAKGIGLHSRARVTYVVPPELNQFRALLGIDDSVRSGGACTVRLRVGDRRPVETIELRAGAAPREVRVELKPQERLCIEVDYGEELDLGDQVVLADARFLTIGERPGQ